MLEILQYVTSSFWVFIGCLVFVCLTSASIGWSLNAVLIGLRGVKCDQTVL